MKYVPGQRVSRTFITVALLLGMSSAICAQEITVANYNSVVIPDGSTVPSLVNGTDFGHTAVLDSASAQYFQLWNLSETDLVLNGPVTITGPDAADFTLESQPVGPINGSVALGIIFDPSASGVRNATVTISSNDADEGTYTFNIMGTGGGFPLASPDLHIDFMTGLKLKYSAKKDTLKLSAKLGLINYGPVPMDSGIMRVYYSADTFLGPEDIELQTIALKPMKADDPNKPRTKKLKLKLLLNGIYSGNIFVQVRSVQPVAEDLYWFDNTQQSSTFAISI